MLPERFQHAHDDRLTPCAGRRLVGAARVPGLRGRAERPFGFVVRSRHGSVSPSGFATGSAVTNVNSCFASISRISSLHSRR